MSATAPRLYIDTCVLIPYTLGPDKDEDYFKVKPVFDGAFSNNYKIMVSNFMLTEALNTLRQLTTKEFYGALQDGTNYHELQFFAHSAEFKDNINGIAIKSFTDMVDLMSTDKEHFDFEEVTSYDLSLFQNSLLIMTAFCGVFKVYNHKCPKCESNLFCNSCATNCSIVYKAINAPDVLHLQLAITLGCTRFVTMDKGFKRLIGQVPIEIIVID